MTLDWEYHRALRAVLREGSLSAAARALRVAQPTVRRRIETLETSLGATLFTRSAAGLTPTASASALVEHLDHMALAAEAVERTASAEAGAIAGTVRISASEVVAVEILPPVLARLRAEHPALTIILSPSNRNEDILRREADIAVRMVEPVQHALIAQRIGPIALGIYAHRDWIARNGEPQTLAEVRAARLIGPEHDNAVLRAMQRRGVAISLDDFRFRTDSDLAQLAAVRAGMGPGVCQVPLAQRNGSLVRLVPDFRFDLETWVVMHEDLRTLARIRTVFDALVAGLRDYRGA